MASNAWLAAPALIIAGLLMGLPVGVITTEEVGTALALVETHVRTTGALAEGGGFELRILFGVPVGKGVIFRR